MARRHFLGLMFTVLVWWSNRDINEVLHHGQENQCAFFNIIDMPSTKSIFGNYSNEVIQTGKGAASKLCSRYRNCVVHSAKIVNGIWKGCNMWRVTAFFLYSLYYQGLYKQSLDLMTLLCSREYVFICREGQYQANWIYFYNTCSAWDMKIEPSHEDRHWILRTWDHVTVWTHIVVCRLRRVLHPLCWIPVSIGRRWYFCSDIVNKTGICIGYCILRRSRCAVSIARTHPAVTGNGTGRFHVVLYSHWPWADFSKLSA